MPAALYVDRGFAAWHRDVLRDPAEATEGRARQLSSALLLTALLFVIGAYASYLAQSLAGAPRVAGLATAAGFPG